MIVKIKRYESSFKKVIADVIHNKLNKDELKLVSVSDVRITNDLSYAKVYLIFLDPSKKASSLNLINKAKGFIKKEIANKIMIRKIPELIFEIDDTLIKARKIEEILGKLNQ